MQTEISCFWSGPTWAKVPPSPGTPNIRGLQGVVVKPLPQKAGPRDLTQSQKVFVRNASLDKAKSQGQQAGGSMLPALNRSRPGLVESLQRRMGCGLGCFKESSVVCCPTAYASL